MAIAENDNPYFMLDLRDGYVWQKVRGETVWRNLGPAEEVCGIFADFLGYVDFEA